MGDSLIDRLPVSLHFAVAGLNNCAVAYTLWKSVPPATRTIPLLSKFAVALKTEGFIGPVGSN